MFLSLKIYQPLCRVVVPAFLLHGTVVLGYQILQFTPIYIDASSIVSNSQVVCISLQRNYNKDIIMIYDVFYHPVAKLNVI